MNDVGARTSFRAFLVNGLAAPFRAVARFQRWVADSVESVPGWPELNAAATQVTWPLRAFAAFAVRRIPGVRRFEWLLETERLVSYPPVLLAGTILFVIYRGLRTTDLGHIGTDLAIYPLLGAISVFNPFLGLVCAICFGAADLLQKLLINDIYGTPQGVVVQYFSLDYWGAMLGYVLAYSSVMLMGLAPGISSRVARHLTRQALRAVFYRHAAASADGATPHGGFGVRLFVRTRPDGTREWQASATSPGPGWQPYTGPMSKEDAAAMLEAVRRDEPPTRTGAPPSRPPGVPGPGQVSTGSPTKSDWTPAASTFGDGVIRRHTPGSIHEPGAGAPFKGGAAESGSRAAGGATDGPFGPGMIHDGGASEWAKGSLFSGGGSSPWGRADGGIRRYHPGTLGEGGAESAWKTNPHGANAWVPGASGMRDGATHGVVGSHAPGGIGAASQDHPFGGRGPTLGAVDGTGFTGAAARETTDAFGQKVERGGAIGDAGSMWHPDAKELGDARESGGAFDGAFDPADVMRHPDEMSRQVVDAADPVTPGQTADSSAAPAPKPRRRARSRPQPPAPAAPGTPVAAAAAQAPQYAPRPRKRDPEPELCGGVLDERPPMPPLQDETVCPPVEDDKEPRSPYTAEDGGPAYPVAELIASLVGAVLGGWGTMRVAPLLEMPAFYLRPNPDVSCFKLEAEKYLIGRAGPVGLEGSIAGNTAENLIKPTPGSGGVGAAGADTVGLQERYDRLIHLLEEANQHGDPEINRRVEELADRYERSGRIEEHELSALEASEAAFAAATAAANARKHEQHNQEHQQFRNDRNARAAAEEAEQARLVDEYNHLVDRVTGSDEEPGDLDSAGGLEKLDDWRQYVVRPDGSIDAAALASMTSAMKWERRQDVARATNESAAEFEKSQFEGDMWGYAETGARVTRNAAIVAGTSVIGGAAGAALATQNATASFLLNTAIGGATGAVSGGTMSWADGGSFKEGAVQGAKGGVAFGGVLGVAIPAGVNPLAAGTATGAVAGGAEAAYRGENVLEGMVSGGFYGAVGAKAGHVATSSVRPGSAWGPATPEFNPAIHGAVDAPGASPRGTNWGRAPSKPSPPVDAMRPRPFTSERMENWGHKPKPREPEPPPEKPYYMRGMIDPDRYVPPTAFPYEPTPRGWFGKPGQLGEPSANQFPGSKGKGEQWIWSPAKGWVKDGWEWPNQAPYFGAKPIENFGTSPSHYERPPAPAKAVGLARDAAPEPPPLPPRQYESPRETNWKQQPPGRASAPTEWQNTDPRQAYRAAERDAQAATEAARVLERRAGEATDRARYIDRLADRHPAAADLPERAEAAKRKAQELRRARDAAEEEMIAARTRQREAAERLAEHLRKQGQQLKDEES